MKKVFSKTLLSLTAGMLLAAPAAYAQLSDADLSYGAYFRLRQETWDDAFDLSDYDTASDFNFFRLKTSLWAKAEWDKQYGVFGKLTNEARYWMSHPGSAAPAFDEWDEDEIVVDNLYASAKNVLGLPVDLTVGRQDFIFQYGEGFLVMEGTPEDGSRTFFFDAVKARVTLNDTTNVDLVYIDNSDDDDRLELDSSREKALNTSHEKGLVVYGRTKMDNLNLEPYYIFKNEERSSGSAYYTQLGELDLHTLGGRAVYKTGPWEARGEFSYQTGEYDVNNVDREGYGGYVFASRLFEGCKYKPQVELGFVYLSGDDPNTPNEDEAFDPLFSRWPWLSELTILTEDLERGIAYNTNQIWYRARLTLLLTEKTGLNLWYNYIKADEQTAANLVESNTVFSHNDTDRGHLYQAQLGHKFTDKVDGYLRIEYFDPGDFYSNQDSAVFVRWQLQAKF